MIKKEKLVSKIEEALDRNDYHSAKEYIEIYAHLDMLGLIEESGNVSQMFIFEDNASHFEMLEKMARENDPFEQGWIQKQTEVKKVFVTLQEAQEFVAEYVFHRETNQEVDFINEMFFRYGPDVMTAFKDFMKSNRLESLLIVNAFKTPIYHFGTDLIDEACNNIGKILAQ